MAKLELYDNHISINKNKDGIDVSREDAELIMRCILIYMGELTCRLDTDRRKVYVSKGTYMSVSLPRIRIELIYSGGLADPIDKDSVREFVNKSLDYMYGLGAK